MIGFIASAASVIVFYFIHGYAIGTNDRLSSLTIYLSIGGGIVSAVAVGVFTLISARDTRRREAYRSRIDKIVDNFDDASNTPAVDPEELRVASYIRQRDAAERELAPYLSANPRRAKRLINRDPSIIGPLEGAGDNSSLQKALTYAIPGVKSSDSLFKLLSKEPKLSPVLDRLVRFETVGKALVPDGTQVPTLL
jgi:hypothetical protein